MSSSAKDIDDRERPILCRMHGSPAIPCDLHLATTKHKQLWPCWESARELVVIFFQSMISQTGPLPVSMHPFANMYIVIYII